MNRFTREVLEKRYKEAREERDKLKADNKWLEREVNRLKKQISKLEKDLLEMSYLVEIKIDEVIGENNGRKSKSNY